MTEPALSGRVALVTGASRGIGHSILVKLAKQGATVIGTATTSEGANRITQFLQENNYQGTGMVLDVGSKESIDALVPAIKEQFGPIGILVNNAAITSDDLFLRMKEEAWLQVLETDLTSIFRLTKACIRDMIKARSGRIINIGSVVGSTGNPGQVNYSAAKAGIIGFSKALASEVGSREITVNVVAPGFIETDMTNKLTQEQREAIFARIPMQKLGNVEDIANAVVFLVSDDARYITGQTLHVNGGMYMN